MSLGLQGGAGVTPQTQRPASAAPGAGHTLTHTHLHSHTVLSPHTHYTPSHLVTLTLAHRGLPSSRSSGMSCARMPVHRAVWPACAPTEPLCTIRGRLCAHLQASALSCTHFLAHFGWLSSPLRLEMRLLFCFPLQLLFLILSFNKEIVFVFVLF